MASNGRPHRLEPRRSESDCRMLLFTSALDPTMIKQPAQHQFTRRHWQVSNSFRSVRGRPVLCAILDESAFWRDESSATAAISRHSKHTQASSRKVKRFYPATSLAGQPKKGELDMNALTAGERFGIKGRRTIRKAAPGQAAQS